MCVLFVKYIVLFRNLWFKEHIIPLLLLFSPSQHITRLPSFMNYFPFSGSPAQRGHTNGNNTMQISSLHYKQKTKVKNIAIFNTKSSSIHKCETYCISNSCLVVLSRLLVHSATVLVVPGLGVQDKQCWTMYLPHLAPF